MNELRGSAENVMGRLLERYDVQRTLKGCMLAFALENDAYMTSEGFGMDAYIEKGIKNERPSIGFIWLVEALLARGQAPRGIRGRPEARLGNRGHAFHESIHFHQPGDVVPASWAVRSTCDESTAKYHLNFSLIGSPAEDLSGRPSRIDRKKFGFIEGITDKEYCTNSSHVPLWYKTSIQHKTKVETPYHLLYNAGAIAYVELDGEATQNVEAFDYVLRCMHDNGVAYGALKHPDNHPACGYHGEIRDVCPSCGRRATKDKPFVRSLPRAREGVSKISLLFACLTPNAKILQ